VYLDVPIFAALLIPVYSFLLLPVVTVFKGEVQGFLTRVSETQWGLMVCVYCVSHIPAILTLDIPGYRYSAFTLVAWLILVVQASDVLQYVWGKSIGRHLLAPRVSPSKTVEGLLGGMLSATVLGMALTPITPFLWWQAGL
ncbi:phosphatidate cytidylyltransferase, partial [Cellulomonas iranensis]